MKKKISTKQVPCSQQGKSPSAETKPTNYKSATGMSYAEAGQSMVESAFLTLPQEMRTLEKAPALLQSLVELEPQDPIEGMLCTQIVALNAQGMHQLAHAEADNVGLDHAERAVNLAMKLLRLKNETIDALTRYRRKGEQKVVVQHINVNDAGKAIIGDLSINGGGVPA